MAGPRITTKIAGKMQNTMREQHLHRRLLGLLLGA